MMYRIAMLFPASESGIGIAVPWHFLEIVAKPGI